MKLPILGRECKLARWTTQQLRFQGTELRHDEAEAMVGRPIVIMPVRIVHDHHVQRCGGTYDDGGNGWCLALAPTVCLEKMPITVED